MKFTLNWLKDFVDLKDEVSIKEISETLTNLGLEIENIVDRREELKDFRVAKIIQTEKHPNADKLKLCQVDNGKEILEIVCGASNARSGIKVILAPIGSIIPNGGFKIKKSEIRGKLSCGMLCSASELLLGNDSSGIIEVDDEFSIGTSVLDVFALDDPIIDVNVTPNRADCLGVYGIARDLSAKSVGKLKSIDFVNYKTEKQPNFKTSINIVNNEKNDCLKLACREIKNIKNTESPKWLKDRLKNIGINSKSAIVDITNYINYTFAKPLHAYDLNKITGNVVNVRKSNQGEKFLALDNNEYNLGGDILVLADKEKILSIAGIMGGVSSMTEDDSTDILLESALFSASEISKNGRDLNIESDSRYRFERFVDPNMVLFALDYATNMILSICGTDKTQISDILLDDNYKRSEKIIEFNINKIEKLVGISLELGVIEDILTKLGFVIKNKKNNNSILEIIVPSWRGDVDNQADIVEEVIRVYGYENIKSKGFIAIDHKTSEANHFASKLNIVRNLLSSKGMNEIVSWSFMSSKKSILYGIHKQELEILNPISSDLDIMRSSLIPNLVDTAKKNYDRGFSSIALMEIGREFSGIKENEQSVVVSGIRIGDNNKKNPHEQVRKYDIFDIKSDLFAVLDLFLIDEFVVDVIKDGFPSYYHPVRSATVKYKNKIIAHFGELHPLISKEIDFPSKERLLMFELKLENLMSAIATSKIKIKPFIANDLQPVYRDFSFVIDRHIAVSGVISDIRKIDAKLIKYVDIFDIYEGKHVGDDKKSIAISVQIQPLEKNITSEEIEDISNKITSYIESKYDAKLRG